MRERSGPALQGLGIVVGAIVVVPAEAVTAVHGAGAGGDQQRAPLVLVQQSGHRAGGAFLERVSDEARHRQGLGAHGQHLSQQGVMGVAPAHAGHIGQRHAQRKAGRGGPQAVGGLPGGDLCRGEAEQGQQFHRIAHRTGQLLLPGGRFQVGKGRRVAGMRFSRYHSPPRKACGRI